jgi:GT2 family glycosyltransferase
LDLQMIRHVSIIVLCWNRWDLTSRCLESIRRCTDLTNVDVIAVDNGSEDETPAKLAKIEWVRTIRSEANLGFVRGNNLGIASASEASDIVLLNNDTEVLTLAWLERLQATAHGANDIGVVGCRLITTEGLLANAGTFILPDTCWGQGIGTFEMDVGQFRTDRNVQGIMFACAYLKREVIKAIGVLSEQFESYFEDTDYCLRAREAGFRTVCCGSVDILHHQHGSTSDKPKLRTQLFEISRQTFRQRWATKIEQEYRYNLHWQSILGFIMGYATSGRQLLPVLDRSGVRVSYSYVYGDGTVWPVSERVDLGDYYLNVLKDRRPQTPSIAVVYGLGNVFSRADGDYRIGYTMLEVDGFPDEWVRQANELDEIWVPTTFNRTTFLRSGLRRPVHVMPLGVDTDRFHPAAMRRRGPGEVFVFLSVAEWNGRKAIEMLMRVFNETFSRNEPAVLFCKVTCYDQAAQVAEQVAAMGLSPRGGRIRILLNRDIPYQQMPMLYRSADCYVSSGHGEGWDLPLTEAMACGLPAIATDWAAHTEYLSEETGYPLRIRGVVPAPRDHRYYSGFSWADPDPDHLSFLLRHVYDHRKDAAAVGRRAAERIAAGFSLTRWAARVTTRLDEIAAERRFARFTQGADTSGTGGHDANGSHRE